MKFLKKNQLIIYVVAIMIMTAGYLNYTSNTSKQTAETSMKIGASDDMSLADIGDATLVNSDDIASEETSEDDSTETSEEQNTNNTETNSENKNIDTVSTNAKIEKDDYFAQSKLERETMYSQMIETYEKILNSSNSSETQKQTATQEITKINDIKNSIMISENLIKTKGFENIVIFVNGESISVIVESEEIKQEEVAQIQNIISREMNAKLENIHISTK